MTDTPNRPPLSPAAQAVLNAYDLASDGRYIDGEWVQDHAGQVAAALRAATDQVVPEADANRSPCREGCVIGAAPGRIRGQLLTLATELEGPA